MEETAIVVIDGGEEIGHLAPLGDANFKVIGPGGATVGTVRSEKAGRAVLVQKFGGTRRKVVAAALAQLHHLEELTNREKGALDNAEKRLAEAYEERDTLEAACRSAEEREAAAPGFKAIEERLERAKRSVEPLRQDWIAKATLEAEARKAFTHHAATMRAPRVMPKPARSIEEARAAVEQEKKHLEIVQHAPAPRAEYEAEIRQMIDEVRRDASVDFDPRERGLDPLGLARILASPEGSDGLPVAQASPGAISLLFRLLGDQLADLLIAKLPPDGQEAITSDVRARRVLAVSDAIDHAEQVEEATVRQYEADGRRVVRRADADPCAVLGVFRR